MGFSQHVATNYGNKSHSSSSIMWRLNIQNVAKAKTDYHDPMTGQTFYGLPYVDVWFLIDPNKAPLVHTHKMGQSEYICAKTFPESNNERDNCIGCQTVNNFFQNNVPVSEESFFIKPSQTTMSMPVYVIGNDNGVLLTSGKGKTNKTIPIFWFELNVSDYKPEYVDNRLRILKSNEQYPMSQYPYRVFYQNSKPAKFYYQPLQMTNEHQIKYDHPLISHYIDANNPSNKMWDNNYYDMIEYLALSKYNQLKIDNRVQSYWGHEERAQQMLAYAKDVLKFPEPSERVEQQQQTPQTHQYPQAHGMPSFNQAVQQFPSQVGFGGNSGTASGAFAPLQPNHGPGPGLPF